MADIDLLYETVNTYSRRAKECYDKKDFASAERFYNLCAEQMFKIAQNTQEGQLKKARVDKAKKFLIFAEDMKRLSAGGALELAENEVEEKVNVEESPKISLEEALNNLNELVGLDRVKKTINDWVKQIQAFQMRKERNLRVPDMSYHLVFSGNPGTGKTTVARIVAQIYHALGILSKGHLVEVERSDLVAGYIGQTAIKTQKVIDAAMGGVLFIDEAYTLSSRSESDFGSEAIATLLKAMEDKRTSFVVVVAGYDDKMDDFISSNPGLNSRFKTKLNFDDYSGLELYKIFLGLCRKNDYKLSDKAKVAMSDYLNELFDSRDDNFGNARDVRNLFEQIVTAQSTRVYANQFATDDELMTITEEDLLFFKRRPPKKTADLPPLKENKPSIISPKEDEDKSTPEQVILDGSQGFDSEFRFTWDNVPVISFEDVAGLENIKEEVRMKVLLPLQRPDAFEGYVKKGGGGLFLYGPPGTGKTMIAAAIAHEIGAKFCSVKPSDLLHQGPGQSEKAVRELFRQARSFPCAVVYFDEMDSISPKNTKSQYAKQLRSELLSQLQGIDSYCKEKGNILFLIAATNKPWDVDSAFIRPGRFGTRIYVGLPDDDARRGIVEKHLNKLRDKRIVEIKNDIDIEAIVNATVGFNCSDIVNLLGKTEELSIRRGLLTGEKYICGEDFDNAIKETNSSVQVDDIVKLTEWMPNNTEE